MSINWKKRIQSKITNDSVLADKLIKAINLFLENEQFILENSLNERTISNKMAHYFQVEFSDYDVDCEYNRMMSDNIDLPFIQKTLNLETEKISSDDSKGTTVYPDIIIHKRGNNDNNLLIIEIKKKEYADKTRKSSNESYKDFDLRKLKAYISQLKYQFGMYVEFDNATISILSIFTNGVDNE